MGRATQGVTLINVDEDSTLSGVRRVVESDADLDDEPAEDGSPAEPAAPEAGDTPDQPGSDDAGAGADPETGEND